MLARLLGLTAMLVAALALSACTSGNPTSEGAAGDPSTSAPTASATPSTSTAPTTSSSPTSSSAATPSPKPTPLGKPVHVSSVEGDGQTYGIGMPIIVRFNVSPTSKAAFDQAAKVTLNGQPAGGSWYWEKPYADQPIEAHYRLQGYWPAHSKIHVDLPVNGLSAGAGLSFANNLTLDYGIGDYHYSVVDAKTLTMKVYNNGKLAKSFKVSLGKASTPTYNGVKVVMQKNNPVRMQGPGYDELVAYSVRITNSGEYVHAAPWNSNIGQASTSNGCTNLDTADAAWFYNFAMIGDVVQYPNAPGQTMPSWDGYGDWNLSWAEWKAGGRL
jgi:lipoprotein-anchoring transpeptidase ErfK/SrfK